MLGIVIIKRLRVLHRYRLIHVRGARERIRQGRAACSLMWRVWELRVHRPALALERRGHTATSLIGLVSEWLRGGRITHLLLVLRIEAASSTTLIRESTTPRSAWSLGVARITHIALPRLRRVPAHVSGLVARC